MENKEFPEQIPLFPPEPEETPVIQELTFEPEAEPIEVPAVEEAPAVPLEESAEIEVLDFTDEALLSSVLPEEDTDTEPAFLVGQPEPDTVLALDKKIPEETSFDEQVPEGSSFMDRIPDVEEQDTLPLTDPTPVQELTADDHALDYHGMLAHGQEESEFDMDILHDPEFAPAPVQQEPGEEITDQEYSDAPPAVAPVPEKQRRQKKDVYSAATRKGRPKRKKGEGLFGLPNILATAVWMALIVAIGVTLGRMLWVCAADVLAFGRPDQKVTVTIYEADSMEDIVGKLHDAGLIRYKSLFNLYADISDAEEDIKPGIYDLNTRYDYHALVNFMSPSSTREVIELTIPEGYTCRQIFALLEENRVCTAQDIAVYAANGQLSDYWFLEDVERGSEYCLEGFLFPDTYQFYKNSSPREALEKLLDNFENRFTEEMRAQIDSLNANVTGGGYGVREVVIVASLIEKESAHASESPAIASVIYNRLHNWDFPAFLNIDAAIVYAQGGDAETIDTSIDSPYNTYRNVGLTPTPISNPGLSSLKAALAPESTDYYFYVLNPATGKHQFSETQAEHDNWIAEFYN